MNPKETLVYNFLIKNREFLIAIYKNQTYLFNKYNRLNGSGENKDKSYQTYIFILHDLLYKENILKYKKENDFINDTEFQELLDFFRKIDTSDVDQENFEKLTRIIYTFFKNENIDIENLDIKNNSNSIFFEIIKTKKITRFKQKMFKNLNEYLRMELSPDLIKKSLKNKKLMNGTYIYDNIKIFDREYLKEKKVIIKEISSLIKKHNNNQLNKEFTIDFTTFVKSSFNSSFLYKDLIKIKQENGTDENNFNILDHDERINYSDGSEINIESVFDGIDLLSNIDQINSFNNSSVLYNINAESNLSLPNSPIFENILSPNVVDQMFTLDEVLLLGGLSSPINLETSVSIIEKVIF